MFKTTQGALMAIVMAGAAVPALAQTATLAPQATTAQTGASSDAMTSPDATKPVAHKKVHHAHHRTAQKSAVPPANTTAPGQTKS